MTIMVLKFENVNLFYTYEGLLEDNTAIRSMVYPMNYMGKTTDTFLWLKFQLPQNLPF